MAKWTRDFDLYVMIPSTIFLAVLNVPLVSRLTGIGLSEWIYSGILLALAVISISILQDRRIRRQLLDQIDVSELGVIQSGYPSHLATEIEKSETVRLIGVSVLSHIKDYLSIFEAKLQRGDQLDVLITDPSSAFVEIASGRDHTNDIEYQRRRIRETIEVLQRLQTLNTGRVRVRLTNAPLDGEYVILYDSDGIARIYFKHYGYKTRYDSAICLHLDARAPHCFSYFKKHVDHLWDYAS